MGSSLYLTARRKSRGSEFSVSLELSVFLIYRSADTEGVVIRLYLGLSHRSADFIVAWLKRRSEFHTSTQTH